MDISEIRVKLIPNPSDRLKAFCSVTLDGDFVIRDIKIIDGTTGTFVAMPSRKLADRCPGCGGKNHLRARYCNDCGHELDRDRAGRDDLGRTKLHADIAHPINTRCRQDMQERIVEAFKEEIGRADEPGYEPVDIDADVDENERFESDEYGSDEHEDRGGATEIAEDDYEHQDENYEDDSYEDVDDDDDDADASEDDFGSDDYNALIEDLKRTSGEKRRKPARAGSFGGRLRDNTRQEKPQNQRSERGGDRSRQTSDKRDQRSQGREEKREREPSRENRERTQSDAAKPVVRKPRPTPPPVAPPPPPPAQEENDDFGAGI